MRSPLRQAAAGKPCAPAAPHRGQPPAHPATHAPAHAATHAPAHPAIHPADAGSHLGGAR